MNEDEEDLTSLMDKATRSMLKEIASAETTVPIADRVRVFGAATDWLAARAKANPPKPPESRIAKLTRKLHAEPKRRKAGFGGDAASSDSDES